MGEQLKNLKCIKQRIISGFFRTINNEFHGFRNKKRISLIQVKAYNIIIIKKLPDVNIFNVTFLYIFI